MSARCAGHSLRNATTGSMIVTRRAGSRQDSNAVPASTHAIVKNVNGSVDED